MKILLDSSVHFEDHEDTCGPREERRGCRRATRVAAGQPKPTIQGSDDAAGVHCVTTQVVPSYPPNWPPFSPPSTGLRNIDLSLAKSFPLGEGRRLQFRAESFNFTNTPAFGLPSPNINSLGAGAITSAGDPR